jgi:glutamate:GABA antiporter
VSDHNPWGPKNQLRPAIGPWDLLLFDVAGVLGRRSIAVAAILFFLPTTSILSERSARFPEPGGLSVWTKKALGEFHRFVAGWTQWIYTVFYFPGLPTATMAMRREAALQAAD